MGRMKTNKQTVYLDDDFFEKKHIDEIKGPNHKNVKKSSKPSRGKSGRGKGAAGKAFVIGVAVIMIIAASVYGAGAFYYRTHFLRGTIINGIDVSGMTFDQLNETIGKYGITIKQRGKKSNEEYVEQIKGKDIGIKILSESGIEDILKNQSLLEWYAESGKTYEQDQLIGFDEDLLEQKVLALKGLNKKYAEKPVNAKISDYDSQKGYVIIKEKQGNFLKKKVTVNAVKDAVTNLLREIDLDKSDCYMKPKINSGDKNLNALLANLNKVVGVTVTYEFDGTKELLDGRTISDWIIIEGTDVKIDRTKCEEYVAGLRRKYDTIFRSRTFETSYDNRTVEIDGGDYGWWMNYVQETEELAAQIEQGKSGKRSPVYYQTAAQYGPKDYGDTYVEINLTAQHLFVYVDGKMELETDFVSGNTSRNMGTNVGVFGITYKERYGELVGETYESTVAYWMPFDGDIGMHDAIWKTQFGSDFYKTDGSHGCINLPYFVAKEIYSLVEKNTPVIVYTLEGTESESVTVQGYEEIANAAIEAIDAIGNVTKDSGDDIETARYMYNKVGSGQKYVTNYDKLVEAEKEFKKLH